SIILQERKTSGETLSPWLTYPAGERPQWENNPPRPDYSFNQDHPYVTEVWSVQEKSDMGSGMFLHDDLLIYTNTSGEVKAARAEDGTTVWTYKTGGKIYSTPTVYNNTVWCASSDSFLYGLDLQNGKQRFKLKNDKAVVSSPACANEKVMIAGSDGHCRAWNVSTGKLLWEFDSVKNFVVTRPLVKDGVIFFGSWGNKFYALDIETGKPRWIWNSGHSNRMLSPAQVVPVATHGRIYLASPDRYMTVLDEDTGEVIWRYNDPENRVRESIGISEDGNTVYAKTMDGDILAIDATVTERKIKWISSGEDMGYELTPTPVVEKNGIVYAPTDKGLIYAYRASDGAFLWKYRISSGLINMILPAENGELYVSAMDGKLVKLKIN
ncbi:PQQ-binding-like beta-propeller repeat protein, partial [uncultured Proteiniphilum sp.]|uniref:outer membrane protein assembly factor BamB family protein n=1 Tax=uncultured Proteiniphilum sp. TaxID=497637 RepID=UPI00260A50F3